MAYASSAGSDQGPLSLERHKIQVAIFPSLTATSFKYKLLTLPQLEDLMHTTEAANKKNLPLLKLAQFGDKRSDAGSLRHNANIGDITGIEVEHDAGKISFDDAIATMEKAKLRCLLYTTPSHTEAAPRWRILLPIAEERCLNSKRVEYVERVNHLFGGALAQESFTLSQTFYLGFTNKKTFETVVLDGDFIDKRPDLPRMSKVVAATAKRDAGERVDDYSTFTIDQLLAHLTERNKAKDPRDVAWHWPMVHLTAKLAARGVTRGDIIMTCATFSDHGADDPVMLDIVRTAIEKYAPKPAINASVLKKALAKAQTRAPNAPPPVLERPAKPDGTDMSARIEWLLDAYGFSSAGKCVVDLFEPSDECRIELKHWRESYADWREVEIGPRGGEKVLRATDAWSVNSRRTRLRGVRMAPDKPFPLFEADGLVYKNTYRRPAHAGTGEVDTWREFMAHLIPDARERSWFEQWMAYKHRHPEVPGVGILFMAKNVFGCGRGILFSIARELYGRRYVRQEDFDVIAGDSSQGAFTDWIVNSVLVCVDETQASPTSHRRGHKLSVYEKFKKVVDPAARSRTVRGKNIAAYESEVYASFWMATNHGDPFVIPENDRRIAVLTNGTKLAEDLAERITTWRDTPGNVAALAAHLNAVDLVGFNAREPIETAGKAAMIEEGYNAAEQALFEIRDATTGAGQPMYGPAFSEAHLKLALMNRQGLSEGQIDGAIKAYTVPVLTAGGGPRRTAATGPKTRIRCFMEHLPFVQSMTDEAIRASFKAWDTPMGGYRPLSAVPRTASDTSGGPVKA